MGVPEAMEDLKEKTSFLRESVHKSQAITETMVTILGSFDHRLSSLEVAMRPTQVRTHAIRRAHENIDKTLKSAGVILEQFDIARKAEAKILRGPHEDLESFLEAISQLRRIVQFFSSTKGLKGPDRVLNHSNALLSKAIAKLDDEFKQILSNYSKTLEPDYLFDCLPSFLRPATILSAEQGEGGKNVFSAINSDQQAQSMKTDIYKLPILIPPRVLPLLHDLAQQMAHAGKHDQCLKFYCEFPHAESIYNQTDFSVLLYNFLLAHLDFSETRSSALESTLRKLGVERLTKDDVQKMPWEVLEAKIGNWIHYMRIAVKLLFAAERKICDQIFVDTNVKKDLCFAQVTSDSVLMLFSFGEAIAKSKRSPEKLFVLLDMYEIMRELQSEVELLFEGKACSELREVSFNLTKRLALTAQETFGDFEEAVEKDATKTTVLDGTVHPLTSYVINYVKFLFDYQSTLKQLFQEFETTGAVENSQLAIVIMRIMQALQSNLDGKSKQYKDPALTYLFLMNNLHYMVRSVRRSEAKDLFGDDWVQRHRRLVQQNANQYRRVAWAKILQTLTVQSSSSSNGSLAGGSDLVGSSGVSRANIKERFKSFNMQFEELHQKQSQWTIPDPELRESLRLAVAEVLLPAYRSFIIRFGPLIENGKNPQKYVRYKPEDLERMLAEFFEGKTLTEPKR